MKKHRKIYLEKATRLLQEIKQHKNKKLDKDCGLSNIIAGFYLLIGRMKRVE